LKLRPGKLHRIRDNLKEGLFIGVLLLSKTCLNRLQMVAENFSARGSDISLVDNSILGRPILGKRCQRIEPERGSFSLFLSV